MDLTAVIAELGQVLTAAHIRTYDFPPDDAKVPFAAVTFPDRIKYDETFGRGQDKITIPIDVVVDRVMDRATPAKLAQYVNGSGALSVKALFEDHEPTAFDEVQVTMAEIEERTMAGVDYVAAVFTVIIYGDGT